MSAKLREGNPEQAGMSPDRVQRVAELARAWVETGITPALAIVVARRGVVVLNKAYGRLTPEQNSPPLQKDTLFPLSSLTKTITATAAMILVEDGLLGLNRPVRWYIPEFMGEGSDAVMVHHLLTHTSGLTEEDVVAHARKRWAAANDVRPEDARWASPEELLPYSYSGMSPHSQGRR